MNGKLLRCKSSERFCNMHQAPSSLEVHDEGVKEEKQEALTMSLAPPFVTRNGQTREARLEICSVLL